jgi:branched-subunit amino acid transport protein AzlD
MDTRRIATFTGWLWIATFVFSIPTRFILYAPILDEPNYVTGAGDVARASLATGAVFELLVIIANVGTAVVPFSILKRQNEAGAVGYVSARIVESMFIGIGILCILAIVTLRQDAPSGTTAALGQGLEAVYEWSFRIGPGFFVGVGNGLILGWLMYTSGLVPRGMAMLGLIGGPLIIASGILGIFDVIEADGPVQAIMTIPEFFWELSLGIYLIVRGFRPSSPILAMDTTIRVPESPSAVRDER